MFQATPCAKCGYLLTEKPPSDRCPRCSPETDLGDVAVQTASLAADRLLAKTVAYVSVTVDAPVGPAHKLPAPGDRVGNYRIIAKLGAGGMGTVFEAEQLDNGRRLALKFISQAFPSTQCRRRFLQEGQHAAAINHPNSVYVFATEEIDNRPVISMELVRGDSLQRYVELNGPLPVRAAVDVILQVSAGLEAADRHEILHRDIKPGNCFIAEGVVKVGDYGLAVAFEGDDRSILESDGAGTPRYASPEQWNRDRLDVRSDLYAVGGTLHFLLTGLPPFAESDTAKLEQRVKHERPPSTHAMRAAVPVDLAKVILRCLEKQPEQRFQNYQELRAALRPFSSEVSQPARPLIRVLAGIIDAIAIFAITAVEFLFMLMIGIDPSEFWKTHPGLMTLNSLWDIAYYGIPEGLCGMSFGKWLLGIRVVNRDRNPPGWRRAWFRAAIFIIFPAIPLWIGTLLKIQSSSDLWLQAVLGGSPLLLFALMFSSMRTRNGYAAWHDLLTGTRVQVNPPAVSRPAISAEIVEMESHSRERVGPYLVQNLIEGTPDYEWLLGHDDVLQRSIWLRRIPANTPPFPPAVCRISRGGRHRWLAGRRTAAENWDAFEALPGKSLVELLKEPQPWSRVRYWLFDLAWELNVGEKEGNLPSHFGLNRIWITSEGVAKLLDVPVPGSATSNSANVEIANDGPNAASRFLYQFVASSLNGRTYSADLAAQTAIVQRLPLHALPIIQGLRKGAVPDWVARQTHSVLTKPTEVSRLRRAAVVLCCLLLPLVGAATLLAFSLMLAIWDRKMPEIKELHNCLIHYEAGPRLKQSRVFTDENDRAKLETYIVGKFKPVIQDPEIWYSPYSLVMIPPIQREAAERIARTRAVPTAAELAEAEQRIQPQLDFQPFASDVALIPLAEAVLMTVLAIHVAIPALLAAAFFGVGPLQSILGIGYVTDDGQAARRLRLFWRAFLAWCPVLLFPPAIAILRLSTGFGLLVYVWMGICVALTVASVLTPNRGLADRLARVWIVRR